MKNLVLLIFFFSLIYYMPSSFSQEVIFNKVTLNKKNKQINQFGDLISHRVLQDTTRPDTTKKQKPKDWWETLLDFSFWNELSGPGPWGGVGIQYPVFKFKNLAVFFGGSFSHSFDNKLQYFKTTTKMVIDTVGPPPDTTFVNIDSCYFCEESKAVQMVSLSVSAQYRLPKSQFDLFFGMGFHTFFGETFATFSRISGVFGGGWRVLKYIRVGLMVNVFEHFKPSKFGAVDAGDSTGSVEFIPGAFFSVSLN